MRRLIKIFTSRLLLVVALVAVQLSFIFMMVYEAAEFSRTMVVLDIFGWAISVYILNRSDEPQYKIAWIAIILGLPVIGVPLYLLAGNRKMPKKLFNGCIKASHKMEGLLLPDPYAVDVLKEEDSNLKATFSYGIVQCGFPAYQNTESQYFKSGEEWFPVYLEELKKAKHFIFIEFFIIEKGEIWDRTLAVLEEKIKEGVEVKMIYDDFGCITLPIKFEKELRSKGIETYRFNHVRPNLIIQMNNRDHRKITVIDNNVAFTGGVNLSDEYANIEKRFGYWKDSAILLRGEAVWSYTVMFLGMFVYLSKQENIDFSRYHLACEKVTDGGFYLPWSDTPTDDENVALNMHMNIISHAKNYVYIDTPYLILPESMKTQLRLAAKNGVDVRILVPGIPDKFLVNQITKGSYERLLLAGVRIYEYTPGFNHCKNMIADDSIATIGSANTDYRSYYLHFEDGVLVHNTKELDKIRDDFIGSLKKSHEVTLEETHKTPMIVRLIRAVLSVFIQLL